MMSDILAFAQRDEADNGQDAAERNRFGVACVGPAAIQLLAIIVLVGWSPGIWLQPAVVGSLWAGLFVTGIIAGRAANFQLASVILAGLTGLLSHMATRALTDLTTSDALLVTTVVVAFGWITGKLHRRSTSGDVASIESVESFKRFSIADISFWTIMVALACKAFQQFDLSLVLLATMWIALIGGIYSCWLACRWVWHDDWSLLSMAALILPLAISFGLLFYYSPMPLGSTVRWLMTGPVNVIAAQATTVLACCALMRLGDQLVPSHAGALPEQAAKSA